MSAAGTSSTLGSDASAAGGRGEVLSGDGVVGRRIGAAIVDVIVLTIVLVVVGLTWGGAYAGHHSAGVHTAGAARWVFVGLVLLYFFLGETLTGQTLGKKMMGIRVMRRDGSRAGAGPVLVRTVLRVIDGLPFLYLVGLISIAASGSSRRQRLGDLAAETVVVADPGHKG